LIGALLGVAFAGWVVYLDVTVRSQFEGRRWALPAHVYTRPLELYAGAALSEKLVKDELDQLGYREAAAVDRPGTYGTGDGRLRIYAREFTFWDSVRPVEQIDVRFSGSHIESLTRSGGGSLDVFRLEPQLLGSLLPNRHEDRSLVRLSDAPKSLLNALFSIEDRNFYQHFGIDPRGMARALWVNVTRGEVAQGGSTITQQLVKNFYLTPERSLQRKITEVIMAMLLELHYSKDEILETYLNEVYLGQAGNRAIHGFGLASNFYFGRPLRELRVPETALLAALVKGPSYFNPRRHPQRARERRNLVLDKMVERGHLSAPDAAAARTAPLAVTERGALTTATNPSYLDLVRLQLQRDYRSGDLSAEGLRIFTTLDPGVQERVAVAVAGRLRSLEREHHLAPGMLEAAVVVIRTDNGEIQALLGGRDPGYAGFNRVLFAERPIGSLIKPVVYLAALEQGSRYTLATRLDDSPLTVKQRGAAPWRPENFDKRSHGDVLLMDALAQSYNLATARLGMDIGAPAVIDVLQRMGLRRPIDPFPSLFLGATNLTPLEVTQMYLTLANGGFRTAMRTVRSVLSRDQRPLARYPLSVEQVFDPAPMSLVTFALQRVVKTGTAAGLAQWFPERLGIAGKTGTTDGFRDSWFAGYGGNYLAVVWVGRDDNKPTGLTGAGGAMLVWADIMRGVPLSPVIVSPPDGVELVLIDEATGERADSGCTGAVKVPFVAGTAPVESAPCAGGVATGKVDRPREEGKFIRWLRGLFGGGKQ